MATQVQLLYGAGVTTSGEIKPAIKNGQLLFDTVSKSIYFDMNDNRIKLYDSLDTALTDIAALQTKVGTETVAKQISDAIDLLKAQVVTAGENSDTITLTISDTDNNSKKIKADLKISPKTDNALTKNIVAGEEGLYVAPPTPAAAYTIVKSDSPDEGFAASYKLMADGAQVGATINIAKDKFLKTVSLVDADGEGTPGKFIKMEFENDAGVIYLNVQDLIDTYTSGSADGDMVIITIDGNNKVTASITDGTITKAKLYVDVQTSLGKADTAVQPADLAKAKETNKYIAGVSVNDGAISFIMEDLPDQKLEWGTFDAIVSP